MLSNGQGMKNNTKYQKTEEIGAFAMASFLLGGRNGNRRTEYSQKGIEHKEIRK